MDLAYQLTGLPICHNSSRLLTGRGQVLSNDYVVRLYLRRPKVFISCTTEMLGEMMRRFRYGSVQ